MSMFARIDLTIFHAIHNLAGKNIFFDAFGYAAAVYVIFALALGVAVVAWCKVYGRRIAWRVLWAMILAFCYNAVIGFFVQQSRPPLVTDVHPLLWPVWPDKSFPSDHAALSFAMAWIIYRSAPQVGKYFVVLAALVALGRVFIGVHFPSDVLIGALVGILCAELVQRIDVKRHNKMHPSRIHDDV